MQDPNRSRKVGIVVGGVLLAAAVYFGLGNRLGAWASAASVLPVTLVAAFFGRRAGFGATAIAFPFNTFLLDLLTRQDDIDAVSPVTAGVTMSLFGLSWAFGTIHSATAARDHEQLLRHAAEEDKQIAEARLREFLTATPAIVFRLGPNDRVIELHGEDQLGFEAERPDYLYRPLTDILPASIAEPIAATATQVRSTATRQMVRVSGPIRGKAVTYDVTMTPAGEHVIGMAFPGHAR